MAITKQEVADIERRFERSIMMKSDYDEDEAKEVIAA